MNVSPNLQSHFNDIEIESSVLSYRYEKLINLGISPEFSVPLAKMFNDIKATTAEIINTQSEMVAANNRIDNQSELNRNTKTNLAMMKSVA